MQQPAVFEFCVLTESFLILYPVVVMNLRKLYMFPLSLSVGFLTYVVFYWKISVNTNHQFLPQRDVLFSSNSNKGVNKETDPNTKEVDETVKQSEVNKVVSIISQLTNINESSLYVSMMRDTLNNLPHTLSLPPGLVNKSGESLVSTMIPPAARITYSETWHGYSLPIFIPNYSGRMGNVMGEYATTYALQKLYNVSVIIDKRGTHSHYLNCFPFLSLPTLPGKYNMSEWKKLKREEWPVYNYASMELAASGFLGPHRFIISANNFESQLFHIYKKDLRQEFTFSSNIILKVQKFLKSVAENRANAGYSDIVFVGFHVRNTLPSTYFKKRAMNRPGALYFNRAMDYYRNKYPGRVVFIATSDKTSVIKKQIGMHSDVYFPPGGSASEDMAMLSSCNHSIITLGSYGFWAGYLTGGEVVYPDVKVSIVYRFSRPFYEKIGLASFTPLPVD